MRHFQRVAAKPERCCYESLMFHDLECVIRTAGVLHFLVI